MDIESLREYCLQKEGTEEGFPFGPDTIVFKTSNKVYLLAGLNNPQLSFNVKCDPEKAVMLREQYPAVTPGYHMNKRHWNTVVVDGSVPERELYSWIDHSYELVKGKKKKA